MADIVTISINELPEAAELQDEGLTVVYQNDETQSIAGSALKAFAQAAIANQVQQATDAADDAEDAKAAAESAQSAAESAKADAEDFADDAEAAKDAAEAAQSAIEDMTVSAHTLATGSPATVTKTEVGGVVNLDFGLPRGNQGEKGDAGTSPSARVEQESTGATIYITDDDGTTTAFIRNGRDGEGSGDMLKEVYDTEGRETDIFDYADTKEPKITAGTSGQYWRGDKTWQTLNKSAVGLGNVDNVKQYSASNEPPYPVTSVNGQTGDVTVAASAGDMFTATLLSSAWTSSGGYKVQTVSVPGILASYDVAPMADVQLSGSDAAADAVLINAFGLVATISTSANSIKAYCAGNAPDVNIPIIINVWGG